MASLDGPVTARFWLLDATDSLRVQSRREPDGWGLGWFDPSSKPHRRRDPIPAWQDEAFTTAATEASSSRFIAHVRYASTGEVDARNTHPFELAGRLCAHNGVIGDLDLLRERLGQERTMVHGETDSELTFALMTIEIERAGGDVAAGIRAAGEWLATHVPVFAWNIVVVTATELHALRWPEQHELWWLQRAPGGRHGTRHFSGSGVEHPLNVTSSDLRSRSAVVVASERMDEDDGWQLLRSGELLSVTRDNGVQVRSILPNDPRFVLTEAMLEPRAAASQQGTRAHDRGR